MGQRNGQSRVCFLAQFAYRLSADCASPVVAIIMTVVLGSLGLAAVALAVFRHTGSRYQARIELRERLLSSTQVTI